MKFEQMGEIAGRASMKEPHELTKEERLALAFMAGCEMEYATAENGAFVLRAKNPVGFQKIGGRWTVAERRS